jgi:CO/xanthine dehydrogenase FAD-binding subunit
MKGIASEFNLTAPANLKDLLETLHSNPGKFQLLAGGTDVMVLFESGKLTHKNWLSLHEIKSLKDISVSKDEIILGSAATYDQIRSHKDLRTEFPSLCHAAELTGSIAIQNRGTLGGNIANGSPAADSPPALLVYGAKIKLISKSDSRMVEYSEFHSGYKKNCMRPDEIIEGIVLPRNQLAKKHYYRKVGTRLAQAISKIVFAGYAEGSGSSQKVRMAIGSVAAMPIRLKTLEDLWMKTKDKNLVTSELEKIIAPLDDVRSTKEYRMRVAKNVLLEFLDHI